MKSAPFLAFIAIAANNVLAGNSLVHNLCDFPVWVTSVASTQSPTTKLPSGQWWSQGQYEDEVGTAIKITRSARGLYEGKPVLHFSYTYHEGKDIYYDLSTHAGFDFQGEKITITGGDDNDDVEVITWNGKPKPNRTAVYEGDTDLILTLCA